MIRMGKIYITNFLKIMIIEKQRVFKPITSQAVRYMRDFGFENLSEKIDNSEKAPSLEASHVGIISPSLFSLSHSLFHLYNQN